MQSSDTDQFPDPYALLGVGKRDTDEQIKSSAFRLLALHHPRAGGDAEAHSRLADAFQRIFQHRAAEEAPGPATAQFAKPETGSPVKRSRRSRTSAAQPKGPRGHHAKSAKNISPRPEAPAKVPSPEPVPEPKGGASAFLESEVVRNRPVEEVVRDLIEAYQPDLDQLPATVQRHLWIGRLWREVVDHHLPYSNLTGAEWARVHRLPFTNKFGEKCARLLSRKQAFEAARGWFELEGRALGWQVSGSGVDWALNLISIHRRATVKGEQPGDHDAPKRRDGPTARERVGSLSDELAAAQAARQQTEMSTLVQNSAEVPV